MKLSDIGDLGKKDALAALGLPSRPSTPDRLIRSLGIFGIGFLAGAGAALLLAPKSGPGLREDLGARFRKIRNGAPDATVSDELAPEPGEVRT
ncbi:MAG TPA: YtxH domain-containing protein [Polyangia bacterium]|jgi:hypothetical protein|nr:YtxH domain-containing protein [Polyangia bacterium]